MPNNHQNDHKQEQLDGVRVDYDDSTLTTNRGTQLSDTDNTLRAGARGPSLLEDFHAREKLTHFDHERIPERVVHARGTGAHGVFRAYDDSLADVTAARFLTDPSRETPVFVRFSTVAGSRGSADTVRDVRGFATKFYTDEGNFDLVGNNMPVFFIQDAIKFPDFVHAVKPEPHNEIPQAQSAHDTFWDFVSLQPEAMHMVMWVMSDHAFPRSFRMMNGFGVHTFRFVNDAGRSTFVKFHWRPLLGAHSLVWDEVTLIAGKDPDFNRRDLWEAIATGSYPEWELSVQLVPEGEEDRFDFDILDATKIIPEEEVPLRPVGRMTLNRNPDNFFAETEQVAMHVGHMVPGIDVSDDPLLQGRLFSYLDTQLIRLGGPNFDQLPINRAVAPVRNNQRDGYGQQEIPVGRQSYAPNSFGGCPAPIPSGYVHFPEQVDGEKIRKRAESFNDHYSQATLFFNSLSEWEREHLIAACAFELSHCAFGHVKERVLECFAHIDGGLASEVAARLGMPAPAAVGENHGRSSPALSLANSPRDSVATRKVAVLAADGADLAGLDAVREALGGDGVLFDVVGAHDGSLNTADGRAVTADQALYSSASVFYDGLLVAGGEESTDALLRQGTALRWVAESYRHGKVLAAYGTGIHVLEAGLSRYATIQETGFVDDRAVVTTAGDVDDAFTTALRDGLAAHRTFDRPVTQDGGAE